jgi:hypothetical protein
MTGIAPGAPAFLGGRYVSEPVFSNWTDGTADRWGRQPLCLTHRLDRDPLFSLDALAALIDHYPAEHYALVNMGAQGDRRLWREGRIGRLGGREVIEAIAHGRMWLNLRRVDLVDARYRAMLDAIFEEVRARIPGYETFDRACGILISSPRAQVYYHADLPGQSLWQLHGRKRVYVYPTGAPFLEDATLERIALYEVEVDMPYEPAFDQSARIFEIGPGEMLHWPLNAPHRVENLDVLNVSLTTEYWSEAIRRSQMVVLANAILRDRLGMRPRRRQTGGAVFWAKAALQAGVRRAGLLQKGRRARRPVTFELDPGRPGAILELGERAAEERSVA